MRTAGGAAAATAGRAAAAAAVVGVTGERSPGKRREENCSDDKLGVSQVCTPSAQNVCLNLLRHASI